MPVEHLTDPSITGEPYYCTNDDVRAEPGLSGLSDADATRLIEDAEDIVDDLLGAWPINLITGRKIYNVGALDWQLAKLARATAKIAALIYANPDLFRQRQYKSVRGPDFAFTDETGPGGITSIVGRDVMAILGQSGLRRLTTRATPRIDQRGLGLLSSQIANGPDEFEDQDEREAFDPPSDWDG